MTRKPSQAALNRRTYPGTSWRTYALTPHFHLGEFYTHPHAEPSRRTMRLCRHFAVTILEPLRDRYGACVIASGHRTPAENAMVGGALRSWHVWEWHPSDIGVDVVFARGTPAQWGEAAAQGHAGGIGVYAAHLHLDDRAKRTEWRSSSA
jgi:uncharacterized protein YcbK (DUF882 family)